MLYYGILTLGANELGPVSNTEMAYCALTLTVSSLLNAILFGDIASLMASRSARGLGRQTRLDESNRVMIGIELPEAEQIEVREYLLKTIALKESQEQYDQFFLTISPSLKVKVQQQIHSEVLETNKVLNRIMLKFTVVWLLRERKGLPALGELKLKEEENNNENPATNFLETLVSKLSTVFATPEESVIKQGE